MATTSLGSGPFCIEIFNTKNCNIAINPPPPLQVVALCLAPSLMDDPSFPADVKERVAGILEGCKVASLGSYMDSSGIEIIRR